MKKFCFFVLLLMGILTAAMAQGPVVSFNCMDDNGNSQRLDSVRIDNWTRSWSVTIYYPNLSISLGDIHTGITELEFDEEGLAQNIPNPFDGRTRAQLTLATSEHILMRVYDMTGRIVAHYEGQLESGKHEFNIVLSTPQTYILQVASSRRNYTIKMVNTGKGGEDKISLMSSEEGEMVLKSAKQIMDYDFEVGDCMNYQGFVTLNGAAVHTEPMVQNQYDSEQITLRVLTQQTTTVPVGVYAGVVGFNNQLYVKPIGLLDNSSINAYHSFINTLPMGNGTILYHADYTALNNIASSPIPDELINVTLVTFTDGLDLGSWRMNPIFTSETAYLNAVHNRIMNDELGGVHITAYAIGVKGSDVTDTARFRYDLRMLSSDPNHNALEVSDISEVNAQFREVAAQLNSSTVTTTDITLLLPAPDPGTRVRFTFDNVTSAENSYCYIDATYTFSNGVGILSDIIYEGLTSTSGTVVTGVAQGIFDSFVFTDIKDNLQQQVSTSNIKQWYYVPSTQQWQRNSEFTTSNITTSQQQHNSAMVMLVLDCSSSLGSGFSTMKSSANNFLDILRNSNSLSAPTVQTQQAITVTDVSANLRGTVTNSGNLIIHEKGFVVSLSPNMSNASYYISNGTSTDFSYSLTGLSPNTTYYYKAYARNNRGVSYGNELSFTTYSGTIQDGQPCPGATTVTDIDNNTYNTVQIGTQCWMKENLRTTRYPNGVSIAIGSGTSTSTGYRYYPANNISNVSTYGYLYNWKAVMSDLSSSSANPSGVQGICPTGWHVPSNAEWKQLTDYVSSQSQYVCDSNNAYIAKALASSIGWNSGSSTCAVGNYPSDNNATGFSALPSGDCNGSDGINYYDLLGNYAYFWSSTQYNDYTAYGCDLRYNNAGVNRGYSHKYVGFSVRCVCDESVSSTTGQPCSGTTTVTDIDNNIYNTVQIGTQCWMKENLRTTRYSNGTSIALGNSTSTSTAYRYYPNNNSLNIFTYGYLYNWKAVMGGSSSSSANPSGVQGICPTGWHVPSNAEWTQLTDYVSSQSQYVCGSNNIYIAKALASTTGWNSSSNTCAVGNYPSANNATGFSALPAGEYAGGYYNFGNGAFLWSATESDDNSAYKRGLYYDSADKSSYSFDKRNGFSVRCVRNESAPSTTQLPTVINTAINDVTDTTATCDGNVTSDGGATVTARGVCWSSSQNPTISNSHTIDGSGTGNFTSNISGLQLNTTYYVRAYATNSAGTAYGNEVSFTAYGGTIQDGQPCPGAATVTDIDNNIYHTVQIGTQCWMKENLRTTRYANGISIALGGSTSTSTAYRYSPNNNSLDVSTYGYLYNWKAVMGGSSSSSANPSGVQGICPTGWHVPSNAEWTQLISYVRSQSQYVCGSGNSYIAKALASTAGWSSSSETCAVGNYPSDNNATGFSVLPAGYYNSDYNYSGETTYFWCATEGNGDYAYWRELSSGNADVFSSSSNKCLGFSVRCVRNERESSTTGQPCPEAATVTDIDNNTYNTVQIGTQCWMKENLRTTRYSNGTSIALGSSTSTSTAYRYYPANNTSNVFTYGYLYNWKAVMGGSSSSSANPSGVQGICPTGWHVPSDAEWTQLTDYVSSQSQYVCGSNNIYIAKALATTTGWSSSSNTCAVGNNPSSNNATGFSALPAGYYNGNYNYSGETTYFWCATEGNGDYAYWCKLSSGNANVFSSSSNKDFGFSVRCVCDESGLSTTPSTPTVTTDTVSNITASTATCGGNVTATGGAIVTARGVCWSISQNPTVSNSHTTNGSGTGSFTSNLTGLAASTTYFVRAYATNSAGTAYGEQKTFTTPSTPTVTTSTISNITATTAICGGNVTATDGTSVTARGVCWSISQNPTVSNNHTTNGSGTGSFTSNLTGLAASTTYFVRAYATNNAGTAYGNEVNFTTNGDTTQYGQPCPGAATVTDIDNNTYNTVQIGTQCWMKENLRTTRYSNGTSIALGSSTSISTVYRCYPNNDSSNVFTYGYLYNWKAVMGNSSTSSSNPSGVQGICPTGWHVPSVTEWTQLTDYVSSQSQYVCGGGDNIYIAKALASTAGWSSSSNTCAVGNNPSTNNATGFSVLPAGYYYGYHCCFGYYTYFWSSTEYDGNSAFIRNFDYINAAVDRRNYNKSYGISVRCLHDESGSSTTPSIPTVTTHTVSNITATTATCGVSVIATGGGSIIALGVCWSTSQNPTISDNHTTNGSGTGDFTSNLTGLIAGTTYYVRAYATNSAGTAYGNELSFTTWEPCPGSATVTDIDNNTYNTVQIGNQCWMRENLRTTRYSNGTSIALGSSTSTTTPYRYYPNNDQSKVSTYGYLYNWKAVMRNSSSSSANPSGIQGICPTGWHVPSDAEWTQLTNYVSSQSQYVCDGDNSYIAKALASTTGWNSNTATCVVGDNPSFNNATGFSALPAGRYSNGGYGYFGGYAYFWSATEYSDYSAYNRSLYYDIANVLRDRYGKNFGFSVRCLRD